MDTAGPTVLWNLWHPADRQHARAVVIPGHPQNTLTFFMNDVMDRAESFDDLDVALFRAADVKTSLLTEGWKEED